METVLAEGQKWALLSKKIKGRTENSVKNRYFSLLGLHSIARKKEKLSPNELKIKIEQKISEIKTKILEKGEYVRLLALRSNAYLPKLPSKDFIRELANEGSENDIMTPGKSSKIDDNKHVTFSEDIITSPAAYLGKFSTKESFPLFLGNRSNKDTNNPDYFTFVEPKNWLTKQPSFLSRYGSEDKILLIQNQEEIAREINQNEGTANPKKIEDSGPKTSFFHKSLSKSFSKLSMASSNKRSSIQKRLPTEPANNPNPDQSSWSKSGNFSSISSISKKNENIPKENSQSSLISLSDANLLPQIRSFIEKSKSNNDSSISIKEWNFLISAVNNLKSEGSSIISAESLKESLKLRMMSQIEEEKN